MRKDNFKMQGKKKQQNCFSVKGGDEKIGNSFQKRRKIKGKKYTHTNKASPRKRRKRNVAVVELEIRRWGQQEKWELRPRSTKNTLFFQKKVKSKEL